MSEFRTRLAPSPTGALHLGNARTFLINWALARRGGWRIVMRIDDLDGPRIKPGADRQALDILTWLGLDWDEGPHTQRADQKRYIAALERLAAGGDIYPCGCSRSMIAGAQSAPHGDEHELRYPGTCRPPQPIPVRFDPTNDKICWRLRVADEPVEFHDAVMGSRTFNVQQSVGDFPVAGRGGSPAYQLAAVIDDADQRISHIIRGDDLAGSTARQKLLQRRLGLPEVGWYAHLPLVLGTDGRRLAKRHGDTRVEKYRASGVRAGRVIGLLARWSGIETGGEPAEMTARQFADAFDLDKLPKEPITFTPEDDRWLESGAG